MSVLVDASLTNAPPLPNRAQMGAQMTGKKVLITATGDTVAMPHYWTSSDGVTWTDGGALPSASTAGPDGSVVPSGIQYSTISHVGKYTIDGQEKLVIWFEVNDNDSHFAASGYSYLGYYEAWWDGVSSFTSARGGYFSSFSQGASGATVSWLGAFYDGTNWGVAGYNSKLFAILLAAGPPGAYKPALGTPTRYAWPGVVGIDAPIDLSVISGTMLVVCPDAYRGRVSLLPAVISGTSVSAGTLENVGPHGQVACDKDGSGYLDILTVVGGTTLVHRKRTGLTTYSDSRTIDSVDPLDPYPRCTRDASSGDLWIVYTNSSAQANGEVKFTRLSGGSFASSDILAGGDASGYTSGRVFDASTGAVNTTYDKGGTSLYFGAAGIGAAPSAPTGLTSGYVVGLTPNVSYTYVDIYPTDTQGWNQYQTSADGVTPDFDSGQVATTSSTVTIAGGAGLAYGVGKYWRVRTWDHLSSGGSGTAGPYSGWTLITPVRGGTVTLTDIYSSGATSSSTITAPTHQVDGGWAQADSHDTDMYQELIWDALGTTLLDSGTPTALSPVVAAGGTFRTDPWTVLLANGSTVKAQLLLRDATTGLWSSSTKNTYTVAYTPPAAPTGFTAIPDSDTGVVDLAWTNDGSAVSVQVELKGPDGIWQDASPSTLVDTLALHPMPLRPYSYRVATVDNVGMVSAWATVTDITLAGQGTQELANWITDIYTGDSVAIGVIDTDSNMAFDRQEDERIYTGSGERLPKANYGLKSYEESATYAVKIMEPQILSDGSFLHAEDVKNALKAIVIRHNPCRFRDPKGHMLYVRLSKWHEEPYSSLHWRVSFSIRETFAPDVPFL